MNRQDDDAEMEPAKSNPLRQEFDELCRLHAEAARQIARRRLGHSLRRRLDSQDVAQEAFLEAARLYLGSGERRPKPEEFRRWLAAVIENRLRSLARFHIEAEKRSVLREVPLQGSDARVSETADNPSTTAIQGELRDRVRKGLESLSPRQREVIDLVKFQGLSVGAAAERMGKTPGSTSVLLYDALRRLAGVIEREEDTKS